jgi:hypothetical protein
MSEAEQDALLDTIEARRRRKAIKARAITLVGCLVALAFVTLVVAT